MRAKKNPRTFPGAKSMGRTSEQGTSPSYPAAPFRPVAATLLLRQVLPCLTLIFIQICLQKSISLKQQHISRQNVEISLVEAGGPGDIVLLPIRA
jgi:hypothetical protein